MRRDCDEDASFPVVSFRSTVEAVPSTVEASEETSSIVMKAVRSLLNGKPEIGRSTWKG